MRTKKTSDNELVLRIKNGDEGAFKLIFDRYYNRLLRFAYSYLRDMHIAENTVQESFILLWEGRDKLLDSTESLFAFLVQVVKLKTQNHIQKQRRRFAIEQQIASNVIRELDLNSYTLDAINDANLYLSEIESIVADTLASLPEQTRAVFQMSREQYLSNREIANHIGRSEKSVEYHISKTLKELRLALADYLHILLLWGGF